MDRVTIGKVAKQAQVRIETLRYYERIGLVAPPLRNGSNYRLYPEETVQRVRFIKRAQELGFSLKEIRELLALQATPETSCADIRTRADTVGEPKSAEICVPHMPSLKAERLENLRQAKGLLEP
jgi:MerR family transcriptional regulator, copper efflux regulator